VWRGILSLGLLSNDGRNQATGQKKQKGEEPKNVSFFEKEEKEWGGNNQERVIHPHLPNIRRLSGEKKRFFPKGYEKERGWFNLKVMEKKKKKKTTEKKGLLLDFSV